MTWIPDVPRRRNDDDIKKLSLRQYRGEENHGERKTKLLEVRWLAKVLRLGIDSVVGSLSEKGRGSRDHRSFCLSYVDGGSDTVTRLQSIIRQM